MVGVSKKTIHSPGVKSKPKNKKDTKKLSPASLTAQRAWAGFSPKLKKELRGVLPDRDKDGVPNGFDCQPRNRKRQEAFLPVDEAFLNSNPEIKIGKKIGGGAFGDVHTVVGNRNLVVKVPKHFVRTPTTSSGARRLAMLGSDNEEEGQFYEDNNLIAEPLFIPTTIVNLGKGEPGDPHPHIGLVRPKIAPVVDKAKSVNKRNVKRITDSQLIEFRQKLIDLSNKGYAFWDGLQVGIDVRGRLLIYDLGIVRKYGPAKRDDVFTMNDEAWRDFLYDIGRNYEDYERFGGELR